MKVLELFAGTRSIGKAFEAKGHEVFSVDWDTSLKDINLYTDISTLEPITVINRFGYPDVVWASPDCTTYSVAALRYHRRKINGNFEAVSEYAKFCDRSNERLIQLINTLHPSLWFIENPRGILRKMPFMENLPRYTVTYCQYGDMRMKPTDIWTNHPNPDFLPPCKNGDPCHTPAPRGSSTGTQGIKGKLNRGVIPPLLCEHIVNICERSLNNDPR